VVNSELLGDQQLANTFIWSEVKSPSEFIDNYTKLSLMRNYTVNGELGAINSLESFKNELYGFQDKGIFNILYNQRAMMQTSLGQDVMLGSTGSVSGVRYLTEYSGCSNKWGIIISNNTLYYIDNISRDLKVMSDNPNSLTDQMGFKTWASDNLKETGVYKTGSENQFILNQDIANNVVYINNKHQSLLLNSRLQQFESFTPHKNIPFMFNAFGEFISVRNRWTLDTLGTVELWVNDKGEYSNFYGEVENSYITYFMNPEPTADKTFDVIQYRMDVFKEEHGFKDIEDFRDFVEGDNYIYQPDDTFHSITFRNEFQNKHFILNPKDRRNPNVRKKMRIWNMPIPRNAGTLQRIRNP
jgi:hypothetical protein